MVLTGQQILYCSENIDKNYAYAVSTSTALSTFSHHNICEITNECGYVTFINNAFFYI